MNEPASKGFSYRALLLPASLLFPVLAIIAFHWGNLKLFGNSGGLFMTLPFSFLNQITLYRIALPEGLLLGVLAAIASIGATGLLGWGLLGKAVANKWIRLWIAFPIGIGFVGVALELLAIAGWFNKGTVLPVYLMAAGVGGYLISRKPGREPEIGPSLPPIQPCGLPLRFLAWSAFGVLVWFSFQHALFYPPTYHDALIYYLYYSKLIFQSGGIPFPVDAEGFPIFVQGQVGLGLGANYAHLFLLWQASVSSLLGAWSSFPGQFIPPLAGLATGFLCYHTVRDRWRSERLALWSLLLVQSVPYWLWYQNWVSDYPMAVWLTLSAVALLTLGNPKCLRVLLALVGIAIAGSHLNYLMVTLWGFPLLSWIAQGQCRWGRKPLLVLAAGLALSSTWFIRNQIVTGNPVYAFFPEIFGGLNIDLEVLRSCEIEWALHGDGFTVLGSNLWERAIGIPEFLLINPRLSIKLATLPVGWFLLGLAFLFWRGRPWDRFKVGVFAYASLLFFYELVISPLYLYHILPLVPLMVLIACEWMARLDRDRRYLGRIHTLLVLIVVLTVGLPAALYGAKWMSPTLRHTLSPGLAEEAFLDLALEDSYRMWRMMNQRLPEGAVVLTHENRHYYLRDDIELLHLDDYRLIPFYDKEPERVVERLKELGVDYYLKVRFEDDHPILRRLGIEELLGKEFTLLAGAPDRGVSLYAFQPDN
jgi:hypothetical protein